MSLRLEMLQVARLSPRALGESTGLVAGFLRGSQAADGGFVDRAGLSDLYYTVFGLDGLVAIHQDLPYERVIPYLNSFGDGEGLDFVHRACLARAWASVSKSTSLAAPPGLLPRLETYRSQDGGYNAVVDSPTGTAYAGFLALGAYEDLRSPLPRADRLVQSIESLRSDDGAYGNHPRMHDGQTSATAAAVAVRRALGEPVDTAIGDWLVARFHSQGGFTAAPAAPLPDLLSTATALHTLSSLQRPIAPLRETCLDFIDSLWTNRGGFYGSWADDHLDCEYTYYGLLALGHLAT